MIQATAQKVSTDSSPPDSLSFPLASKKKKNAPPATLFSSLLEKARGSAKADSSKEGEGAKFAGRAKTAEGANFTEGAEFAFGKSGLRLQAKTAALRSPGEGETPSAESGAAASAAKTRKRGLQTAAPLSPQSPKSAQAELSSQAARATAASKEQVAGSEARDALSGTPSPSAKNRFSAEAEKPRKREPGDPSSDGQLAAAAGNGGALFAAQRQAKTDAAKAAGEERAEAVDGKKKDKRRDRLEIEVHDQRKTEGFGASMETAPRTLANESAGGERSSSGADIVLSLRDGAGGDGGGASESAASAGRAKESFSDALARELRDVYNTDIVKRASITLKDGGEGLIRLSLKPESLGAVKIRLELADNKIAGRILVESEEALKAFGKELRSLEQAFVDGGFDGASLELALSSGDAGSGSGRRESADSARPFFSDRLIAEEYEAAVPNADSSGRRSFGVRDDALIDMLA